MHGVVIGIQLRHVAHAAPVFGFGVWCLGYGVWGLVFLSSWFMIHDYGVRVWSEGYSFGKSHMPALLSGLVFGVWCLVFGVWCLVIGVWGSGNGVYFFFEFMIRDSWFMVHGSGCRVQGSGCRIKGSKFEAQSSGFRV